MGLHRITIRNFRLLADVELVLEGDATLIVGRNNSGKTSLPELVRRFVGDNNPVFQIEDFSTVCHEGFFAALDARNQGADDGAVRALIPAIELRMLFQYSPTAEDLGPLSDFVVDLNPDCSDALVVARYELKDGGIEGFFEGQPTTILTAETREEFMRTLRPRIPAMFTTKIWAEDPNDALNRKPVALSALRTLLKVGFINAQRGLDDITTRETDVLAKVLENLFTSATSATADAAERAIADALQEAVRGIQDKIEQDFSSKLKALLPTFKTFGYPGLNSPELQTETTLEVRKLLSNNTKVRYAGYNGIALPESYNGLGTRNLIFILLQIVSFHRAYRAEIPSPGVHLIFIEEPEAHLHPQMQEVFIRQLAKMTEQLSGLNPEEPVWPVQFVVSTHSSHIANEAGFEAVRYFLPFEKGAAGVWQTKVKDLREGMSNSEDREFLHQYLTLTRCDLFFADKAILVEGLERLVLPVMIEKLELSEPELPKLSRQYVTTIEVGGAFAHRFFPLMDFLELPVLIITDLDPVEGPGGKACLACQGTATSNACLKSWFDGEECSPASLISKPEAEKVRGVHRIAFQVPENGKECCGRTFEDAFILANQEKFTVDRDQREALERSARELAQNDKKSDFALRFAIGDTEWVTPRYIAEGLRWLAVCGGNIVSGQPTGGEAAEAEAMTEIGVAN